MNKKKLSRVFTWPNILTFGRIGAIPLLIVVYYSPLSHAHAYAAVIFFIASFTDWLDGYLARYLQQISKLGAFLDPVADKLMVCIALIVIAAERQFQFISFSYEILTLPAAALTIPAAIIVAREIVVSALREWMAELGKRRKVAVNTLGKIKTLVQMMSLIILLYCDQLTDFRIVLSGYILLYIASILTIWSMIIYIRASWLELTRN